MPLRQADTLNLNYREPVCLSILT